MDSEKKVKPVIKKTVVSHAENTDFHPDVPIPDGHAYVIPLIDGREDVTQAFFYPLRNVYKVYGNEAKFVIKKKGNQ